MTVYKKYHIATRNEEGQWILRDKSKFLDETKRQFAIEVTLYGTENVKVFEWVPMAVEVSVELLCKENEAGEADD